MTAIDAFLRSIEVNLADPAPMLIFADWLEEHDMGQVAYAWRWMARRGYRPARRRRSLARLPWAWWHESSEAMDEHPTDRLDAHAHPEARLPFIVFRATIEPAGALAAHVYSPTLAGAVNRLARGLQLLREQAGLGRQAGDP